jgi:hypothetical protein
MGFAKQSVWGTAVAPTFFSRWLDGSDAEPNTKVQKEREGDTSPFVALMYKTEQMWELKVVEYIRPIGVGFILQALLGTGSDAFTAPTQATTLSAPITVGANTFNVNGAIGTVGNAFFNFTPGYASAAYEVANVNLASKTGAGPFTYTLQSGTFQNAHSTSDVVNNASVHVMTRQQTTYDAYAWEVAFGNSTFGKVFRISNCVCTGLTLSSDMGKPLKLEHTWVGSQSAIQATFTTISQEGTNLVGVAGGPLVHFHGGSSWSIDGSTSGNAAGIRSLKLTLKNSTKPEDMQSELVYAPYFIPGDFEIDGQIQVIFESYAQYLNTFFGSASATTGATDSYLVGYGAFTTTWTSDGVNSLAVSLPYVGYTGAKLDPPKLDAKPLYQTLLFSAYKTPAFPTPITFTLNNSQSSAY